MQKIDSPISDFVVNDKNGAKRHFGLVEGKMQYGGDDSIGNDGAHDGDGLGHERGDHTNHYSFVAFKDYHQQVQLPEPTASLDEIVRSLEKR
jgi:hypothetical protein